MVVKQTADRQAVPEPEESDYQSWLHFQSGRRL
jgi:hypothetical protein